MEIDNNSPSKVVGALPAAPFHVLVKPAGPLCNLRCEYCFYLKKTSLFPAGTSFRMTHDTLEQFTRQYIEGQEASEITFSWQGGEPTLMGLDFYRDAVALQNRYSRPGLSIVNAMQTNGHLLNEEWCQFLMRNRFLVGLSLDGPQELHDAYRKRPDGSATFERSMEALRLLQVNGVEFNVLCVVNDRNGRQPLTTYRFFRDQGVQFIQFIPLVEQESGGALSGRSVPPDVWGKFLCAIFDEWAANDMRSVSVQNIDTALAAYAGMQAPVCATAPTCGRCLALEHDGSLYSCDHYVNARHRLGTIFNSTLAEMVDSRFQTKFGADKRDNLPDECRKCAVLFACGGGCPKDRSKRTGLNALCSGYKRFFTHSGPQLRQIALDLAYRSR